MRRSPLSALPPAALLLAALLTAASTSVFADAPPQTIPADQLLPTMNAELDGLRDKIAGIEDPQARAKVSQLLDKTEAEFSRRLGRIAGETNYAIEAKYLGDWFERSVLKPTHEAIRVMKDGHLDRGEKKRHVADIYSAVAKGGGNFSEFFYRKNKRMIDAIVALRREAAQSKHGRPAGGERGGGAEPGRNVMSQFQWLSPLIRVGRRSYDAATSPNPGGNNPPIDDAGPSGGSAGGDSPGGDSPGGGAGNTSSDGPSWSDIISDNVPALAPQAITDGAGRALQEGDYVEAVSLARLALQFNPGNKDAMGILKSAEGRASPGLALPRAPFPESSESGRASDGSAQGVSPSHGAGALARLAGPRTSMMASSRKLDEARRALALGDFSAAAAAARRALELNPNNAAAHNLLAVIYARMGDYRRAIASAGAGLALAPRDASLLNNRAFAQNRSKRYHDALASANGAIEADALNAYAYANRAYAYGGLGDRSAMLSDIGRAAALDARFAKAAADAAALQLPSDADVLFLFPGEASTEPAPAAPARRRSRSFGLVVGAAALGGLLLALGLLATVPALKDSVVAALTQATRRSPSVRAPQEAATPEPVSAAGHVGGVIRGQYEIVRQIGAGGMGMVYEGVDRSLGRRVAIKKMRDELRLNPRERERFIIEAKTVASLRHPNIVDIYAIAEAGDDVYLVFEYVDGQTVHDLVQTAGRLGPAESLRLTCAMGEALAYAHSHGVIHRDMKPSNVMLTSEGQVKVMDFGIARMAKDALTRCSLTNTVVGTPPYMAPEQEQGMVRRESDVYSLAICSYEMLTGKLPFIGVAAGMLMNKINMSYVPPSRATAGLREALDEVFLKAFQADPERRYRTPQEFAAALEAVAGGACFSTDPV